MDGYFDLIEPQKKESIMTKQTFSGDLRYEDSFDYGEGALFLDMPDKKTLRLVPEAPGVQIVPAVFFSPLLLNKNDTEAEVTGTRSPDKDILLVASANDINFKNNSLGAASQKMGLSFEPW